MSDKMNQRLRILRENAGLTQEELAKRVGVKPLVISHYETGARTPSLPVFRRLAQLLDVTMDMLYAGEPLPTGHACAYCGAEVTQFCQDGDENDAPWYSVCDTCFAQGPSAPSRRVAIMVGRARGNAMEILASEEEADQREDVAT